jgi:tryptophan synthase alpha chain
VPELEAALRGRRDGGGRGFVPYVTGGLPGVDAGLLQALRDTGADAIEVGIPFSDPVMDGGVIQEASAAALAAGAHPSDILATIAKAALDIPVAVMT